MQLLLLGVVLLAMTGCGVEGRLYLPGEKTPPPLPNKFESKEEEPVNSMRMKL